jgi:tetratricopeptide (TPR) repeat protein
MTRRGDCSNAVLGARSLGVRVLRLRFVGYLLFLCCLSDGAAAQEPPDHERWQASVAATDAAIAANDLDAVKTGLYQAFEQAVRMPDGDARLGSTDALLTRAMGAVVKIKPSAVAEVVLRLNDLTKVPNGLANYLSRRPAQIAYGAAMGVRDFARAQAIMRDMADRAAADFGPAHTAVLLGRRQEATAAAATGDFDYALKRLDEVLDGTRRAFGAQSAQYLDVLISIATVHAQRNDLAATIQRADEATALVRTLGTTVPVTVSNPLADLYESAGELEKARDLYLRGDWSDSPALDKAALAVVAQFAHLADVNARLGDGAAARRYTSRATDLGRRVARDCPQCYLEALYAEAALESAAGNLDRAAAALTIVDEVAPAAIVPTNRIRTVAAYAAAGQYDRALRDAEELLRTLDPRLPLYADVERVVVLSAGQKVPPEARTELAESIVKIERARNPNREPTEALYALALSYSAEGRWSESAELQERVLAEATKRRQLAWSKWRTFATALDRSGRVSEATAIRARVESEQAPLAAALATSETPDGVQFAQHSAFGYDVALTDPKWHRSDGATMEWPQATFAAMWHAEPESDASLYIIPLPLPDGIDADAAMAGLLRFFLKDPATFKPWTNGQLKGYEHQGTEPGRSARNFDHNWRVVIGDQAVYLIVAQAVENDPGAAEAAARAANQVSIGRRPDLQSLSAADRKTYGFLLNKVGMELSKDRRLEEALVTLAAAGKFDDSLDLRRNIIVANINARHYDVALAEIERYPGGIAAHPPLYLWRANIEQVLGNTEAALADYRAGFATGLHDDGYVDAYVALLVQEKRSDEVMTFLDRYGGVAPSVEVATLQALVSFRFADRERLDRALTVLEDPRRSNPKGASVAALVHLRAGGVDELAAFVARVPSPLASVELYVTLAQAQVDARRFDEALATVRRGLTFAPSSEELRGLEAVIRKQVSPTL